MPSPLGERGGKVRDGSVTSKGRVSDGSRVTFSTGRGVMRGPGGQLGGQARRIFEGQLRAMSLWTVAPRMRALLTHKNGEDGRAGLTT